MAIDQRDVSSTLRFMDDRALQQYAALHKNDPYIFPLAFQESQNRQRLRMQQQVAQAAQPQPKVTEQALAQMAPQPMPETQGIGALPARNMQQMADGGIAGYDDDANFAQRSEPVVMMAEGGHVPRYQGNPVDGSLVRARGPYANAPYAGVMGDIPGYTPGVTPFMPQAGAPEELPFFQRQLAAAREKGMQYQLSQAQARIAQGVGTAPDFAIVAEAQRKADASAPPTRRADYETTAPAPKVDAAPKVDTGRKDTERRVKPAIDTARKEPAAEKASEPTGLDALIAQRTRETELAQGALRNQRVGLASQLEQEALGAKEEGEKRRKERGDVFASREARLAEREKGIAGLGDKYMGLALLQAGAAMMSTPGNLGSVLGKGIQVGSERYIAGIDKINAAKDKFAEARDRLDELRLNRDDMNEKEIKEENSAIRRARVQGQQLFLEGATKDLEISNTNMNKILGIVADDLKTDKTIKAERENVLIRERGATARANAPTSDMREAMLLGTGNTPEEKYLSGLRVKKELLGDKQGTQLLKLFLEENGRREKNAETPLTLDQFRRTAAAFYAPPAPVDTNKPTRP